MNEIGAVGGALNTAAVWYENSILMTFIGVILGAIIGFAGSLIQSRIAAKNNIAVVKAQAQNEIKKHYYFEKEKLYSELIDYIPQFLFAIDKASQKIHLSNEQKIQLNSFKARLRIFADKEIHDEFYALISYITQEADETKITERINAFTEMLLEDLKHTVQSD